ncbi:MAG: KamA family radical SAM protein [Desulfotalea sp.]
MNTWKDILQDSITTNEDFLEFVKKLPTNDEIFTLPEQLNFPMKINPYFLKLIEETGDPIWRQSVPSELEMEDIVCIADPLGEELYSPVKSLVHKYPDRALLLVTGQCAMFCRFCTRNRAVGTTLSNISDLELENCLEYLREHKEIREVLISGGDPLLLDDDRLDYILHKVSELKNIELIRIGSRIPCTLPMRITDSLVNILKKYHPLYINIHFNHPKELTVEAERACAKLANAGIPLGSQTVLLKGINDNYKTLKTLFRGLLRMRVKPYYLFQADLTFGTNHFRTHSSTGIAIMKNLYGHLSGMAIPRLALDAPGGKGKIPLTPNYIKGHSKRNLIFENYLGEECSYPEIIDINN